MSEQQIPKLEISLRDHLAVTALPAILGSTHIMSALARVSDDDICPAVAAYAYGLADAMLIARDVKKLSSEEELDRRIEQMAQDALDQSFFSIDEFEGGYMLCDKSPDTPGSPTIETQYCGKSVEWRLQPAVPDPFDTEDEAKAALQKVLKELLEDQADESL